MGSETELRFFLYLVKRMSLLRVIPSAVEESINNCHSRPVT